MFVKFLLHHFLALTGKGLKDVFSFQISPRAKLALCHGRIMG